MKYFLLFIGALVLISQASALAIRPFSNFMKPQIEVSQHNDDLGNTNIAPSDKRDRSFFDEDDLFFSYFLNKTILDTFDDHGDAGTPDNSITPTPTKTNTNTTLDTRGASKDSGDGRDYSTLGREGKVPLNTLPQCYQRCMIDDCCNKMYRGGPGDVRELTTKEFCDTQWFYVGNWLFDHVQYCVKETCTSCPGCREESNKWMVRTCGTRSQRGWPNKNPPSP